MKKVRLKKICLGAVLLTSFSITGQLLADDGSTSSSDIAVTSTSSSAEKTLSTQESTLSTKEKTSSSSSESTETTLSSTKATESTTTSTTTTTTTTSSSSEETNDSPELKYSAHVSNIGWQSFVENGKTAGTTGKNLEVEALQFSLKSDKIKGNLKARVHVRKLGWMDWQDASKVVGTTGKALSLEAIQLKLDGEIASSYDIYYRVHVQNFGWLDWASNGKAAGSEGYAYNIEAIEVRLIKKGDAVPNNVANPYKVNVGLVSQGHVSNIGWQPLSYNGKIGTTGRNLPLEAMRLKISGSPVNGNIAYRAHVRDIGWQNYVYNNTTAGTVGRAKSIEAVQIKLTGNLAEKYDVYYRVHSQNIGWLGWAKNGEQAGTQGFAYHAEALEIKIVEKNSSGPKQTGNAFYNKSQLVTKEKPRLSYQTFNNNVGWQNVASDGQVAGTTGKALSISGIKASVNSSVISGNISYQAHISNIGWASWKNANENAGTNRTYNTIEALKFKLNGQLSTMYDIYYRVHSRNIGWMGWTKNGQPAGTKGFAYPIEAVQLQLVVKNQTFKGNMSNPYKEKLKEIVMTNVPWISQYRPVFAPWGCASAAMAMLIESRGIHVDLKYAQDTLPMYPANKDGQKGNVYTGVGFGFVIKPSGLVRHAHKWTKAVYDISGSSTQKIIDTVLNGQPVLYYGFSGYQVPGDYNRNHCKVIVGYKDGKFKVHDPLYMRASDGLGSRGTNKTYSRGAIHWITIAQFNQEYQGNAITIK